MLDQYAINTKNANGICKVNEIDWKHFWAVIENLGKGILVFQQRYTNGTRPTPTSDSRILNYVNSFIKYGIPKRKDTHARKENANKRAVTKPGLKEKHPKGRPTGNRKENTSFNGWHWKEKQFGKAWRNEL